MNALENAKQLKVELDSFRPLSGEIEARIMQKFRLDWNYHSNNLEGNSLTYGETKALLLFGITAQGKPLKDHFEITGHNEAINWILDLVKGETELTEVFIRQLHELLLKESHYKEAVTGEGKPTRRKIEVGKYKTQPNHVITVTGETFFFATPEETPIKMQELIDWFRNERDKNGVNPIVLASLFHYKFIRIHPFDDGNGRTARILMNFILMQFGFPPVIIRTEDKENYYRVLRLADADELEPFIEYIAENLVRSLEIMIKGSKGENIEEADDLDKELALLDRKLDILGEKANVALNWDSFVLFIENTFLPLLNNFHSVCKKFERFYTTTSYFIVTNPSKFVATNRVKYETLFSNETTLPELLHEFGNKFQVPLENEIQEIAIKCIFNSFNRIIADEISYSSEVIFILNNRHFSVLNENGETILQKGYNGIISDSEIHKIMISLTNPHKKLIEQKIEESNQSSP